MKVTSTKSHRFFATFGLCASFAMGGCASMDMQALGDGVAMAKMFGETKVLGEQAKLLKAQRQEQQLVNGLMKRR